MRRVLSSFSGLVTEWMR